MQTALAHLLLVVLVAADVQALELVLQVADLVGTLGDLLERGLLTLCTLPH